MHTLFARRLRLPTLVAVAALVWASAGHAEDSEELSKPPEVEAGSVVIEAEPLPIDAPPVTLVIVRLKVSFGSFTASASVVTLNATIGFC